MTLAQRDFDIPPFYCPVPDAAYDKAEEADAGALAWMFQQGFRKEGDWLAKIKAGSFTAQCMPFVLDRYAEVITYVMYWGGAWDDDLDVFPKTNKPGPLAAHIVRLKNVLASPEAEVRPDEPYVASFRDFWRCIGELASPNQLECLRQGFCTYFDAVIWKCANEESDTLPSLGEYLVMRGNDVGGPWMTALTPIGGGYEVAANERQDPRVRAATQAVSLVVGLDNDLISAHREKLQGVFPQNIIDILIRDNEYSLAEAVQEAQRIRDRVMCLYLQLRDGVTRTASPGLRRYIHEIAYWVRGHIVWSDYTTRYNSPIDPLSGDEKSFGGHGAAWADEPADGSLTPLAIPEIAWWWDQLDY